MIGKSFDKLTRYRLCAHAGRGGIAA